ncbi:hypothetical protein A28LD_2033 [Idiomarina sp. A28L]|uniref:gamma-mobile-trio protein GmtX n=1 Tax=Idiomarina sp. A28L TaxID=1036674 RepID=UPI0002138A4B|nr:gamma-mobile-trio protein GmtX [Idiomarina sp. A28L]EGN74539.1 hypothetical protein A28LD_2033 [Idiomarina sp. A28L]
MNPEDVLTALKSDSSPKASRTLDAIYEICREQEERGVYEFSPSVISRLGLKRGVPRAQSIINKTGERYRTLLRAFEDKHSNSAKSVVTSNKESDWIDEIPNPAHRLLIRAQESELKAAKKLLREIVPPGERIDVFDYQHSEQSNDAKLSDIERRALQYIISQEFLSRWSFSTTEYGEIVDGDGNVVLRAATVNAVEKALINL